MRNKILATLTLTFALVMTGASMISTEVSASPVQWDGQTKMYTAYTNKTPAAALDEANSDLIRKSANGEAWRFKQTGTTWFVKGSKIKFKDAAEPVVAGEGQHEYGEEKQGEDIQLAGWVCDWKNHYCVHQNDRISAYGETFGPDICLKNNVSGWRAVCADCGEKFGGFEYATPQQLARVNAIPAGMDYYYPCANCNHLDQGYTITHVCKSKVSNNKYTFVYNSNGGIYYMAPSIFYYDNATEYDGEPVEGETALKKCVFERLGYTFVGWNTEKDGSGISFKDEQEIFNYDGTVYDEKENPHTVKDTNKCKLTLYAQWKKSESTLHINANGGSFDGTETDFTYTVDEEGNNIASITKLWGDSYNVDNGILKTMKAPEGVVTTFDTMGGNTIDPVTSVCVFSCWHQSADMNGVFYEEDVTVGSKVIKKGTYKFKGKFGTEDTLTAIWEPDPIVLPTPTRTNYVFCGWYSREDCEDSSFVGVGGDSYTPARKTTLYAKWTTLKLTAKNDYSSNNGKGAVDLTWTKLQDKTSKQYKIYQSLNGKDWTKITKVDSSSENGYISDINATIPYKEAVQSYTVPYSGIYTITAYGAQGGDYILDESKNHSDTMASHTGGNGGMTQIKVWLNKGEQLKITTGGQNGYFGGGNYDYRKASTAGVFSTGGGCTHVTLYNSSNSKRNINLMIAAGGGGATPTLDGSDVLNYFYVDGGEESGQGIRQNEDGSPIDPDFYKSEHITKGESTKIDYKNPEAGGAGGGAGYYGGISGVTQGHSHSGNKNAGGGCYKKHNAVYCRASTIRNMGLDTNAGTTQTVWYKYYCSTCNGYFTAHNGAAYCQRLISPAYCSLDCTYKDFPDGYITSSTPAYGGVSYINTDFAITYKGSSDDRGNNSGGNGCVIIHGGDDIYTSNTSLSDVPAPDLAAPDPVDKDNMVFSNTKVNTGKNQITGRVSWTKPADNGTTYYHKVEAYTITTNAKDKSKTDVVYACTSNITENILTTNVANYKVVVDRNKNTDPTNITNYTDIIAAGGWGATRTTAYADYTLPGTAYPYYVHIVAVDKAGNVSPVTHYEVTGNSVPGPDPEDPDILTGQIGISAEYGNIKQDTKATDSTRTFYVKADGKTPFLLTFDSFINAPKQLPDFQISDLFFASGKGADGQAFRVTVPSGTEMEQPYGDKEITKQDYVLTDPLSATDTPLSVPGFFTDAKVTGLKNSSVVIRNQGNTANTIYIGQRFVVPEDYNGKTVTVIPRAMAFDTGTDIYKESDPEKDRENGLTITADGEGPDVTVNNKSGTDAIIEEILKVITSPDKSEIKITASDKLSGLKDITVDIENRDNYCEMSYSLNGAIASDGTGTLTINTEDFPFLYLGEVSFLITAVDEVGNETVIDYNFDNIKIHTELIRLRVDQHRDDDGDGLIDFKSGESGSLTIVTTGYVDRVKIDFQDTGITDKKFTYDYNNEYMYGPGYSTDGSTIVLDRETQTVIQTYEFMIPLESEKQDYEITITAYKKDENGNEYVVKEKQKYEVIGRLTDELKSIIIQ